MSDNRYLERHGTGEEVFGAPSFRPDMIVCLPVMNEPELTRTIESLHKSHIACAKKILVLILFNHPAHIAEEVKRANEGRYASFINIKNSFETGRFQIQCAIKSLSGKHAGVGLARKLLMDEAVRLLDIAQNRSGILISMDGDCTVEENYFEAIGDFFDRHPRWEAASVYFEHPLPEETGLRTAIATYELHLRYFVEAQRIIEFPSAFHTVGSSMAVRNEAYQKEGGMNRRQAGEDFYFLMKFARKGRLGNLTGTTVYPSPRISDRVPFGTGRAIGQYLQNKQPLLSHDLKIFEEIRVLFDKIPSLRQADEKKLRVIIKNLPAAVQSFLEQVKFEDRIKEIKKHTATLEAFIKRFYNWFDGFLMMKYVHFAREHCHPDLPVALPAYELAVRHLGYCGPNEEEALLLFYRKRQRHQK